jgi:hypothetical protein
VRKEASYIWRELLAARGLTANRPKKSERPHISLPAKDHGPLVRSLAGSPHRDAAGVVVARRVQTSGMGYPDVLLGIVLPAMLFLGALTYKLGRERA